MDPYEFYGSVFQQLVEIALKNFIDWLRGLIVMGMKLI